MQMAEVRPEYSFIMVSDGDTPNVPRGLPGNLVAATETCIIIGCRSVDDGPTKIVLSSADSCVATGSPVFAGILKTESGKIAVSKFPFVTVLSELVDRPKTHVQVFANDPSEPDFVEILFT